MTLQTQLKSLQEKQRLRSLEQREAAVAEKERLLDDKERLNHLKNLDKSIEFKQQNIEGLEVKIASRDRELMSAQSELGDIKLKISQLDERYKKNCLKSEKDTSLSRNVLDNLKKQRDAVYKDLKDQQAYLAEQEIIVNTVIGEWNETLGELKEAADKAHREKITILEELTGLRQQKTPIDAEIKGLQSKLEALNDTYKENLVRMKAKLKSVGDQTSQETDNLKLIIRDQQIVKDDLLKREKTLIAKENNLIKREIDLNQQEKALNLKLGIIRV